MLMIRTVFLLSSGVEDVEHAHLAVHVQRLAVRVLCIGDGNQKMMWNVSWVYDMRIRWMIERKKVFKKMFLPIVGSYSVRGKK